MKITMDGEYAFENNPTEKVRILCVDGPGNWPVIGVLPNGIPFQRELDGTLEHYQSLIPLQRQPREFWVNVCPKYSVLHKTEHSALHNCMSNGETIHVREVLE